MGILNSTELQIAVTTLTGVAHLGGGRPAKQKVTSLIPG